jgi:hypothetical protein
MSSPGPTAITDKLLEQYGCGPVQFTGTTDALYERLVASVSGWVLGDVATGGRSYFYVPVSAHAATYCPRVQRFDKVMLEVPAPQAP